VKKLAVLPAQVQVAETLDVTVFGSFPRRPWRLNIIPVSVA
jgi:hypothetical protein